MKIEHIIILLVVSLHLITPACSQPDDFNNYLYPGQTLPGDIPQVFAPGFVSTEHLETGSPAISPNGSEIYWSRIELPLHENISKIMYIKNENGIWSKPEVASFSGFYPDYTPLFSYDGNKLYFASEREFFVWREQTHKKKSGWEKIVNNAIHVVTRYGDDWSAPACLTPPNSFRSRSTITEWVDNVNICYLSLIGRNEWDDEIYREYHGLDHSIFPAIKNSFSYNYTPWMAGDGSYIMFSSTRNPCREDYGDLYICFRQSSNKWSNAIFMGNAINTPALERCPSVSPDGKYLFFTRATSEMDQDIFWLSAKIISDIKKENNLQ